MCFLVLDLPVTDPRLGHISAVSVPFIETRNAMMLRHNSLSINTLHDRKALCFDRFLYDVEGLLSYPRISSQCVGTAGALDVSLFTLA